MLGRNTGYNQCGLGLERRGYEGGEFACAF